MARGDRTGGRHHPDIPLLPAPLIGRLAELAAARQLLIGGARLVTLTGPPGVGKTSLALALGAELLDRFADGAVLVDLSAVTDPNLVPVAIAETLGVTGRRQPIGRLIAALRQRKLLLVLDNFEQVVTAAPVVAALLASCSFVTFLITSREPLRLRWEHELPVPPLALPDSAGLHTAESLARVPAVRLFVERARAVNPGFALTDQNAPAVASICVRLDGLPLAIELAAARARLLAPAAMLRRLLGPEPHGAAGLAGGTALGLLTAGPRDLPLRQQTLRAAIAWSHALLTSDEQRLFRRLAVFVGGFDLDAATGIGFQILDFGDDEGHLPSPKTQHPSSKALDLVESLVEKCLMRREVLADGTARLRMLETIREYARELLLASGETDAISALHLEYFLKLAERAKPELSGRNQVAWLDRLTRDQDNLRAATRWAVEHGDAEAVLRLGAALWRFWWVRVDGEEARERVASILALADGVGPSAARARALHGAGVLARLLGDYPAAQAMFEQSRDIAAAIGDRHAMASALYDLGRLAYFQGDHASSRRLLEESLDVLRTLDPHPVLASTLASLGYLEYLEGRYGQARSWAEQGLQVARLLDDQRTTADAIHLLGLSFHAERATDPARRQYEACLRIFEALGDRHTISMTLGDLGGLATMDGDVAGARAYFRAGLSMAREAGNRRRVALMLLAVAGLMAAVGDADRAIRLEAAAMRALDSLRVVLPPAMRAISDSQLGPARYALGKAGVAAALAAGLDLPFERAVDEALAWLGPPTRRADGAQPGAEDVGLGRLGQGSQATLPRSGPVVPEERVRTSPGSLTKREREVAVLLARGCTNRQIAGVLVISERTAGTYVQRVMNRLGLHNRAQVAVWAVEHGLHEQASPRDQAC